MNETAIRAEQADELIRRGEFDKAARVFRQVLESAPDNFQALLFLGTRALRAGQVGESIALLEHACATNPEHPVAYVTLGRAQLERGDSEAALACFDQALALNSSLPLALLCKGIALERSGRPYEAASAFHAALLQGQQSGEWSNIEALAPNLRELIAHAAAVSRKCRHDILHECLEPVRARHGREALKRIEACMAIYLREAKAEYPHPLQWPTFLFIPGLPARPFYADHTLFPWLAEAEAATAEVQAEMGRAMREESGFQPVVSENDGFAADYWHEVNNRMDWNGFYFYRHGERYDEHCARCPKTAALLDSLPLLREPGHSPETHFSVLQPGAHIPVHTGVVNARLVIHLPLIIPPDCGIRIAGDVHTWDEGTCLVFDDTFEHEAWNHSDQTRVVLIFDTWNPYLTEAERDAFSAVVQCISGTPLLSIRPNPEATRGGHA